MKTFSDPRRLQKWCAARRIAGAKIALVPTMGALHEGHLSLIAAAKAQGAKLKAAYQAAKGSDDAGYAVEVITSGSQGDIDMIVGVDADGAVTGVSIVENKETSGIGSKVMDNEPLAGGTGVLDQFIGKSGAGSLVVKKNVDAISGATVSSKGVTKGVNAALAVAEALG